MKAVEMLQDVVEESLETAETQLNNFRRRQHDWFNRRFPRAAQSRGLRMREERQEERQEMGTWPMPGDQSIKG